jgi:DNA repair exonuclease SbcCD ATPase subunit
VASRNRLLLFATALAFLVGAGEASAQVPGIVELRRLISQREPEIARQEARQRTLETRGDSLSQVKRRTAAGSAQFETVSNEIRETGDQLIQTARALRTLYEQMRDLRTKLYTAYNQAIAETSQRIERLPKTTENTAELSRLTETLRQYVAAREALVPEIEEAQDDLFLPDLVLDPTDGPFQLRVKEAIARDAIDKIDERIQAIGEQIATLLRKERDREEFQRLKEDIELWGDRQAAQGGSEIQAILEGRNAPGGRGATGDMFDDPSQRIRDFQRRLLDLEDRRQEYAAKAAVFAERLQEFYH